MKPTIAFLGVGLMGNPMVENLLKHSFPVILWNRTIEKLQPFDGRARQAKTPAEAVSNADIVITMLENGPVVDSVLYTSGAVRQAKSDSVIIDMSSIPPAMARRHATTVSSLGAHYIDAPVSGGTVGAANATLSIMAGGEPNIIERIKPVFDCFGKTTIIGPHGAGQVAKLANQAIVGITIGAVSEALLLAAKGGANPDAVRAALMGGFASSRILDLHGKRMIDRNFEPGARASIQLKDLRMILDEARESNLALPLSQRVYEEYLNLCAHGHSNVDHSGLLLQLEQLNQTTLG